LTISQCSFLCYVHARYTQQNKQNSSVIQQKYDGRLKWTVTGLHLLILTVLLRLPNTDRLQQVDDYVRGYVNGHDSVDIITFLRHYIYPTILYIYIRNIWEPSWPWSYGSWIYNYLCNQCLSILMFWVRISIRARCTTLCDKVV
jgi:hypothetical protein